MAPVGACAGQPRRAALVGLRADRLGSYRATHPLARIMPVISELMGAYAMGGEHLLAVCDAHGTLLWVEGHAAARRRAGLMNFVEGLGVVASTVLTMP